MARPQVPVPPPWAVISPEDAAVAAKIITLAEANFATPATAGYPKVDCILVPGRFQQTFMWMSNGVPEGVVLKTDIDEPIVQFKDRTSMHLKDL